MNVADATNELFKFYLKNDTFELGKNFHDVILISEYPEEHKAALLSALSQMEETGLVKRQSFGGKDYHTLTVPLDSWEQQVPLGGDTAAQVGAEINEMCEQIDDTRDYCDCTSVREKDILNLVNIIRIYKDKSGDSMNGKS